jgi:hypothetical protein
MMIVTRVEVFFLSQLVIGVVKRLKIKMCCPHSKVTKLGLGVSTVFRRTESTRAQSDGSTTRSRRNTVHKRVNVLVQDNWRWFWNFLGLTASPHLAVSCFNHLGFRPFIPLQLVFDSFIRYPSYFSDFRATNRHRP